MSKKKVIFALMVALLVILVLKQYINYPIEQEETETTAEEDDYVPYYQVYVAKNVFSNSSKLSDIKSLMVYCNTNAVWEEWGSKNHTAKIIIESDGILFQEKEIELLNFPASKYSSKGWNYELNLPEDKIYKDVGDIKVTLQRTNDDGTVSNMSEYTLYYVVRNGEIHFETEQYNVFDYVKEGCVVYKSGIDDITETMEIILLDPSSDKMYVIELYWGNELRDDTLTAYTYETTQEGKYIVNDYEGNQVFTLEELETGVITDGEKTYKETEDW